MLLQAAFLANCKMRVMALSGLLIGLVSCGNMAQTKQKIERNGEIIESGREQSIPSFWWWVDDLNTN